MGLFKNRLYGPVLHNWNPTWLRYVVILSVYADRVSEGGEYRPQYASMRIEVFAHVLCYAEAWDMEHHWASLHGWINNNADLGKS